jgi:seryl-tRNA synthetase
MKGGASGGFVHAPSLNHAATAAVLRSGYLAHRSAGGDQPFAIDLSSERVRRARWLLEGVRQGQSLAALLGYRFERGLHENHPGLELDYLVDKFRTLAPLGEIYRARAEKWEAQRRATELEKGAQAKRAEWARLVDDADRALSRLEASRPAVATQLERAQADVSAFEAEIQKIQRSRPTPPDPDAPKRLAALKAALAQAQRRVSQLTTQLADLDVQIKSASRNTAVVRKNARPLEADARALDASAAVEREREHAADTRELDLIAQRRRSLLLPDAANTATFESIEANNVVDGLALHARYRKAIESVPDARWDYDTIPFGKPLPPPEGAPLPAVRSDEFQAIVAELRALDESIDAVADAVTAESVYQAMMGNPMRAAASLDAVARAETPPPELEVIRTPRTGIAVTHRVVVLLPDASGDHAWQSDSRQARALAEPQIDAWAAHVLGDPRRILFRAEYVVDGAVAAARDVALGEVALSPLDVLWTAGDGRRGRADVLELRLRYELLRRRPESVRADATVRLDFGRAESWTSEAVSVDEMLVVARALSEIIASSRALDSADLEPAESAGASTLDVDELSSRVDRLVAAFEAAHVRLEIAGTAPDESDDEIREALLALTYFDVDAVPVNDGSRTASDRQALVDQATIVHAETTNRIRRLRETTAGVDRGGLVTAERVDLEQTRAAIVLGKAFRIVPRFTPPTGAAFDQSATAAGTLLDGDALAPLTWLQRAARVRPNVAELNDILTYTQCLNPAAEPDLRVLQAPWETTDRWAGLAFDQNPARATLSVVSYVPSRLSRSTPSRLAGLMVDEWVEVTPRQKEQTGVAFNFDAPGSRPPQAILLAVAPGDRSTWDIETVESIVSETMELARLRMVESAQLDDQVSQFLPALYFGLNREGDTVSTDFRRATAAPIT